MSRAGPLISHAMRTVLVVDDERQIAAIARDYLGLGLTIARNLIEAHGGTIRAESRVNAGTTIVFSLPR